MEPVTVENGVIVQPDAVEHEAIGLGEGAELLQAVRTRLAGWQEHCVDHGGGIADRAKDVAVALERFLSDFLEVQPNEAEGSRGPLLGAAADVCHLALDQRASFTEHVCGLDGTFWCHAVCSQDLVNSDMVHVAHARVP